jgi:hypothetical protein
VRPRELTRPDGHSPRAPVYGGAAAQPQAPKEPLYGGAAARAPAELGSAHPVYDVTFKMSLDRPPADKPRPPMPSESGEKTDPGMPPVPDENDDDEDGETQLMDRDAPSAQVLAALALRHRTAPAARPAFPADGTPSASIGAIELPPAPKPSRLPQIVALAVGIVIAVAGVLIWWQLDNEPAPAPAESASAAGGAVPPKPPETAPTAPATPTVTPTATAVVAPTATAAPPPSGRWPPKRGKGRLPGAPEPAPAPAPAPKPPEAPQTPDDMANPYRRP